MQPLKRGRCALWALVGALVLWGQPVHAQQPAAERSLYVHVLGTATAGKSLRFNNPYRLSKPLGSTPESVSLAATYADLSIAALFGSAWGLQHGGWLHWSTALSGVGQDVVAPSYVALWRGRGPLMFYGRVGLPFVIGPNANVGGELAGGGVYMLTGALGVTAELGGSAFYGAATREVSASLVPLLSLQAGLTIDWEVLP